MPTRLPIRLIWDQGHVSAVIQDADDAAAAGVLVRRAGLPRWVEVGGVVYRAVFGSEAERIRERIDQTGRLT